MKGSLASQRGRDPQVENRGSEEGGSHGGPDVKPMCERKLLLASHLGEKLLSLFLFSTQRILPAQLFPGGGSSQSPGHMEKSNLYRRHLLFSGMTSHVASLSLERHIAFLGCLGSTLGAFTQVGINTVTKSCGCAGPGF